MLRQSSSAFTVLLCLTLALIMSTSASSLISANKMVYTTVKENQAKYTTISSKVYFTWYLKSGIVNMTLGDTTYVDQTTINNMYRSIGSIGITKVVEVNDSYTNLHLQFENVEAANTVLTQINLKSWNAIKKSGIILATDKAPTPPTAEPRTMLFGGIIAVAAVFSAGVSAFIVRRMALAKYEKNHKTKRDMANLEAQLVKEQIRKMGGSEKLLNHRNNKKFGNNHNNNPNSGYYEDEQELMMNGDKNPYYNEMMQEAPGGGGGGYASPPFVQTGEIVEQDYDDFDRKSTTSRKSRKSNAGPPASSNSRKAPSKNGGSVVSSKKKQQKHQDEFDEYYERESVAATNRGVGGGSRSGSRAPPSEVKSTTAKSRSSRRKEK